VNNAKFIIPAAIGLWLLGPILFAPNRPGWVHVVGGIGCFLGIAGLVGFLLIRNTGWPALAARYPARHAVPGPWHPCRTVVMALVPVEDPGYERAKVRIVSILRVATTEESLNLAAIGPLRPIIPALQIPWTAMVRARRLDPSGWVRGPQEPGALFQLTYDPGYTGDFVEIELHEPTVFLQLPLGVLGEAAGKLPIVRR